jgi:hypothetical protein
MLSSSSIDDVKYKSNAPIVSQRAQSFPITLQNRDDLIRTLSNYSTRVMECSNERDASFPDGCVEEYMEVMLVQEESIEVLLDEELLIDTTSSTSKSQPRSQPNLTLQSSSEIIRQLVKSNFLDYKEMGRLLLFVSKSTVSLGFLCDDLWKSLLVNRFGDDIACKMMESLNCGPHQCFRHLIKTEPRKSIPQRFVPSDYRIIINLYDDIGRRIMFRILRGENIERFFDDGYIVMKGSDGLREPIFTKYSGIFRTKATVHIVRIPDQKSICIIDDKKGLNEYSLEKKYFIFTTSLCPSSSLSLVDESATQLLANMMEFSQGIYFNLRMKIRRTNSRDRNCTDGCNVALYGNLVLEAVCYPTCESFKDGRKRNMNAKFSQILEKFYGWSSQI